MCDHRQTAKSEQVRTAVGVGIEALQRLPGVGPKTAQRMTFFLLKRPLDEVRELSESLLAVKERIV